VQAVIAPLDLSIHRAAVTDFLLPGVLVLGLAAATLLARNAVSPPAALAGAAGLSLYAVLAPSTVAVGNFGILSDRYLYPVVPLVLLLFALLLRVCAQRARVRLVAYAVTSAWALTCLAVWPAAARAWRDDMALFSRALAVAPDHTESWYRVGQLLAHRGEWTRAARLLERAIEIDPTNQRARNNLGVVRLNQGRYAEAVRELEITLRLTGGKHYKACFNKSLALLGLGQRARACDQLRACVAVNPAYERSRQALREHCAAP
jgi:tetratricopeptide (TPR) repeat protein